MYNIIAVIGAQSSGKSTLMNRAFGCDFQTLDSSQFRQQTTKGIWCSRDSSKPIILFDVEGSDSKERWEERHSFERSTALFALVMCNVLVVNVWTQEIGRFTASNYEIIKVIFELNIKFFNQETPKSIIFAIRDFDDSYENVESIKRTITSDINRIFEEISKPSHLVHISSDRIFQVDFQFFPHLKYRSSEFDKAAVEFRDKFTNEKNPSYFLKGFDYKTNLPIDGLSEYMTRVWAQIRSNKELNLPSQKIMVSNFRCSEIKKEAFAVVEAKLDGFVQKSKTQMIEKIGLEFGEIKKAVLGYYDKNAGDYLEEVVNEKREDLLMELNLKLDTIRKNNIALMQKTLLFEFDGKIAEVKREKDLKTAMRACRHLCSGFIHSFENYLKETSFCPSVEEDNRSTANFQSLVDSKLSDFINSKINVFTKALQTSKQKDIDGKLSTLFSDLNSTLWDDLKEFYDDGIVEIFKQFSQFKDEFPEIEKIITMEYIIQVQCEFHRMLESSLRHKATSLNKVVLEKFRKIFERSNGIRRNWKNISEEEIVHLWTNAKETCLATFTNFKGKGLAPFSPTPNPSWTPDSGTPVLTKEELDKCRSRFEDSVNEELETVYAKKNSQGGLDKVPKWLWLVLLYFMHDNILEWMRSPWIFGICLVVFATLGYLFATERAGQIGMVSKGFYQAYGIVRALLASKGITIPSFEMTETRKKNLDRTSSSPSSTTDNIPAPQFFEKSPSRMTASTMPKFHHERASTMNPDE